MQFIKTTGSFSEFLHILTSSSTSLLTLHIPVKTIFPQKSLQRDSFRVPWFKMFMQSFFNTLLLSRYKLQMLKQRMDLPGLLSVLVDAFLQKRQLCFSNSIGFLFLRSLDFLLSNLEISRVAMHNPCFSDRKREHLCSDLTKTNIFHSSCHRIFEWLGFGRDLDTIWFQPLLP